MVLEKTLESPLDYKEIKPVNLKSSLSHDIKICLLLGRKAMTNLDSILKSKDITFLINVCILKAMVFPIVMYRCKSWTMKAEHRRTDAFKLWCWRRLLRVPWIARRSNQPILKECESESCSVMSDSLWPHGVLQARILEWVAVPWNQPLIFIGKTDAEAPILWPPDGKSQLIGKVPDPGKDWRQKEEGKQRMRQLDSITDSTDKNMSKLWEIVEDRVVWCAAVHGVTKSRTRLSDQTTEKYYEAPASVHRGSKMCKQVVLAVNTEFLKLSHACGSPEALVKMQVLVEHVWGRAWDSAFLTSSQGMWMLWGTDIVFTRQKQL